MRQTLAALFLTLALLAFSVPAQAGGWATVRLDEPPDDVRVDVPWKFGFMVRQHDVTPNSDVTPVVTATHKATGEELTATSRQEGPEGHFVAEITFPDSGDWKWEITPEPYAGTSFETLNVGVGDAADARTQTATIQSGRCANPGEIAFHLGDVETNAMTEKPSATDVAVGTATIAVPLAELASREHAISVGDSERGPLACGDLPGVVASDELVVALQPWNGSGEAGIAILRGEGEQTMVTLYLLDLAAEEPALASAKPATVEITGTFQPALLEAPAGTTVTWVNASAVAHSVAGDDLGFDDSGLIDPGQSFSTTFDTPGTFTYHCAPHPGMEGVIVVT